MTMAWLVDVAASARCAEIAGWAIETPKTDTVAKRTPGTIRTDISPHPANSPLGQPPDVRRILDVSF